MVVALPQAREPSGFFPVSAKPPLNQPQVTDFLLRRSPMFSPDIVTRVLFAVPRTGVRRQLSKPGRGSPMRAPELRPPAIAPAGLPGVVPLAAKGSMLAPPVLPEMRLTAPTLEGPKLVPKELSLMAKC